jgi:dienelactone hydrolase
MMTLILAAALMQDVKGETVDYKDRDVQLMGYVAHDPKVQGKRPVVLIVHEWKGFGDYVKRRADMVAKLGYLAFAVDMYGKGVFAKDHEEAGKLAGALKGDRKKMRERIKAALDHIRTHELADSGRMAVMGYCFGGTTALEVARANMEGVKLVASFHGALARGSKEDAPIKAHVLVFHGADDRFVPAPEVEGFRTEMSERKTELTMKTYDGAVHSFTVKEAGDDPSKGMAYNAKADKESWDTLTKFLADVLK